MGKVILGTTMSVDGFINDRNDSVAALYPDLVALRETEPMQESIRNTGVVVMGRNSFALAEDPDTYAETYEYQMPIFVLTHQLPKKHPKENDRLTLTFVMDGIESAIRQAKAAAGGNNVTILQVREWKDCGTLGPEPAHTGEVAKSVRNVLALILTT